MASNQYLNIFKFPGKEEKEKIVNLVKSQKVENRIATRARILLLRAKDLPSPVDLIRKDRER
ncbi:MAG: hypothetical protein DRP87_14990 [Spirochaetes bacterium]|nr:MAG: hypothetical protein DRP87_14990 [Spirochaetota bacterium]